MVESLNIWAEPVTPFSPMTAWADLAETVGAAPQSVQVSVQAIDLGLEQGVAVTCIRLDMESLQCFESVDRQFADWGVVFANTIAISPSNPSYPAYSGNMVLMSAPKNGYLEATFLRPASFVSGFVTSSRRAVLTAFDAENQAIARTETEGANLALGADLMEDSGLIAAENFDKPNHPNAQLVLSAANIHRITIHALGGQLTLDDFCFCLKNEG
ncbi:MAG: hypothetical protein KME15_20340 [Drouetiella hepatica Uher 2000/2452]|jgi:hypothetical protein|uniref:Uncharacterized protein n=1 Tax=Drouetiella hepatica Uher 2000/2452 TaxID=904376 RepID=A0A951QE27_9CYAN|nr:hypothetical protein [Drouetiella hepatica Uher 2000/2452]